MANPSALPNPEPGSDAGGDQVWLTAGEAADAANVTHQQVAAWVAGRTLSSRMGWRGGAEIQLVLLTDLESLAERVDLDRVRGSLAERGVFTGPRRVVLGGFKDGSDADESEQGGKVVVKAAHQVRPEDRVWASELDGEVRRLRQVIRTLRDDHESLERHLDAQAAESRNSASLDSVASLAGAALERDASDSAPTPVSGSPAIAGAKSPEDGAGTGLSSGAMLAMACGVVLGMIGAAIAFPGARTMASEKRGIEQAGADESATQSPANVVDPPSEAETRLAILALDAMDQDVLGVEEAPEATESEPSVVAAGSFGGSFTDAQGHSATSSTGDFFAGFLKGDSDLSPSGVTAASEDSAAEALEIPVVVGPELAPDLQPKAPLDSGVATAVEASARIDSRSADPEIAQDMLVEPPPLLPRARGVKPNSKGAPKRLRVPMSLAELDRTLFARRSALLSDCAYTEHVSAASDGAEPSAALVLGPCFGPTREGQSGAVAAPGTHRVGSVACCRHHAFVERLTAAALDETARFGLLSEAKLALAEGMLPPLFRLRANRSATRFMREETRGWTSAGLDGIAGTAQSEDAVHEWRLADDQPGNGSIRVELLSWIQPVVPFDAAKFKSAGASSKEEGMKRFHMTILVQAAPDGDVLEGFEWLID